jgi:hypothetical protein
MVMQVAQIGNVAAAGFHLQVLWGGDANGSNSGATEPVEDAVDDCAGRQFPILQIRPGLSPPATEPPGWANEWI